MKLEWSVSGLTYVKSTQNIKMLHTINSGSVLVSWLLGLYSELVSDVCGLCSWFMWVILAYISPCRVCEYCVYILHTLW